MYKTEKLTYEDSTGKYTEAIQLLGSETIDQPNYDYYLQVLGRKFYTS